MLFGGKRPTAKGYGERDGSGRRGRVFYKYFAARGPPRRGLGVIASLVTIDHVPGPTSDRNQVALGPVERKILSLPSKASAEATSVIIWKLYAQVFRIEQSCLAA